MSQNELPGIQSADRSLPDVESLLKQMKMRCPSDELDVRIANVVSNGGMYQRPIAARFGWTAIFVTAVAAMLAGIWLGFSFASTGENSQGSQVASVDSNLPDAKLLTPISFNLQAFNLLHGHSQQTEFEKCEQCHQESAKDATLMEVFQGWFYGDEYFFEAHPDGLADCSKCHDVAVAVEGEFAQILHQKFAKLVDCSQCHKVDADGFEGFKKDWHAETGSSAG